MEIRYVTKEDDIGRISSIYEQSWRHTYKGMLPKSYLKRIPEGNWNDRINRFGSNSMVIVSGDDYIGTVSFGASHIGKYDGCGEIYSLYLLPQYIGMGLGIRLLDRALSELASLGYEKVFLFVLDCNLAARRFYERYGFVPSGDMMKKKFGRKMVTEVMYTIELKK